MNCDRQDDATATDALVEQARTEAERRLLEIDIEEARACGKTEAIVSSVTNNDQIAGDGPPAVGHDNR